MGAVGPPEDGLGGEDGAAQGRLRGRGLRSRGRSPPRRLLARSACEFPFALLPSRYCLIYFPPFFFGLENFLKVGIFFSVFAPFSGFATAR